MNENEKILQRVKACLADTSKGMVYDFHERKDEKDYQKRLEEFRSLPRTFVGQMIEAFDIRFENNIIYITDIVLGFLEALSILPLEFEDMSDTGRYEVYLNNEPWAVMEYKGMPENDPESNLVHFGAISQLTLNQLVKKVVIDLEIPGDGDSDVASEN